MSSNDSFNELKINIVICDKLCDNNPHMLFGNTAFWLNGLTTLYSVTPVISTLYTSIGYLQTSMLNFVFNPWGSDISYSCIPFRYTKHLFLPSAERALCEGIQLRESLDEGILVESLQSYLYRNNWNGSALREMAKRYRIHDLDYWIQEAREWETA